MRYTQAFAITLVGLLLAVGCTKAETPADGAAKPVAIVNGKPISKDVWQLYVKTRHQGKDAEQLSPEERSEALEELIGMYVGAAEAEKQKLAEGEPNARLELVQRSALAEMLFRKVTEGKEPTEEELQAEYDARIAELPQTEYHARHILVDDEAKAKDLIAQIDKGASFEKLAKENSADGSANDGGDLGWFNPGQMVKPFSDAVQQLEVGKYTATPVKTDFGWHVIKLEETRPTTPPPYDAVKAQLGPLVKQKQFEAHLKELIGKAKVERKL
ncbi:MAG: peptidylprolyl isomerase [Steroidobacteraceae bacterium]|nr:peptidylprolyl isomerase [Steroidobacteraceae bacterium]